MKIKCSLFMLFTLFLMLTGCAANTVKTTNMEHSNTDANDDVHYSYENVFVNEEDFIEFILSEKAMEQPLIEKAEDKKISENTIEIFSPAQPPKGFFLDCIRQHGNYATYYYKSSESMYDNYKDLESEFSLKNKKSSEGIELQRDNEIVEPIELEEQEQIQSEMNSLGREGYIEKYGLTQGDLETIKEMTTQYTFTWAYAADGKELLKNTVEQLELTESDLPGYYYELIKYPGIDDYLVYSVYWEQDGYQFHVNMPISSQKDSFSISNDFDQNAFQAKKAEESIGNQYEE